MGNPFGIGLQVNPIIKRTDFPESPSLIAQFVTTAPKTKIIGLVMEFTTNAVVKNRSVRLSVVGSGSQSLYDKISPVVQPESTTKRYYYSINYPLLETAFDINATIPSIRQPLPDMWFEIGTQFSFGAVNLDVGDTFLNGAVIIEELPN